MERSSFGPGKKEKRFGEKKDKKEKKGLEKRKTKKV